MLIRKKKGMLAVVSAMAILLCGCAYQMNMPVAEEGPVQEEAKALEAYVTIEEEAVPMAAVPQAVTEQETEPVVDEQPMPTQEVEVSLQEEEIHVKVVVETESEETVPEATATVDVAPKMAAVAENTPEATVQDESFDAATFAAGVQQAVNEARAAAGLPGLSMTPELSAAAARRAAEITGSFSHTRPGGTDYHTAVTEAGGSFGSVGENLFRGTESVTAVQNAWNGSEVHLENILNDSFSHIGVGVIETPNGVYVVQIFTD